MIISEKFLNELIRLEENIEHIKNNKNLIDKQIENFLKDFERVRYNILNEIKIYNKNVEFEHEKIKNIDDEYKAELQNNILKLYIPEVMPSYKNLKTHTYKRLLLNIAEITKKYEKQFDEEIAIYIKVFDNILNWDIDNKYIKPISDGLILSNVIKDDNISKMFYCVKGEFSETPHTEVYIFNSKDLINFLENTSTQK